MIELKSTGIKFPDNKEQYTAIFPGLIILLPYSSPIPSGWAICDGTNGTPDLRDYFLPCAGGLYSLGDAGGSDTVSLTAPQLPSHTHPAPGTITTDSIGAHTHTITVATVNAPHSHTTGSSLTPGSPIKSAPGSRGGLSSGLNPSGDHAHTVSISPAGTHSHSASISVGDAGLGDGHENRPPYYAAILVIKL